MFNDLIYEKFPECSSPCSFMKITIHLTSQFTDNKPDTKLYFSKEVKITSEKVKQSFSSAGEICVIFLMILYLIFSGRSWWIFRHGSRG